MPRVKPGETPGYTSTRDTHLYTVPDGLTWINCLVCGRTSFEDYCHRHRARVVLEVVVDARPDLTTALGVRGETPEQIREVLEAVIEQAEDK